MNTLHLPAADAATSLTAVSAPHIETCTNGAIVFHCDGMPVGQIAGCFLLKNFMLCWLAPYQSSHASYFDHMPSVEECEEEFREMRIGIGVDPYTGKWNG